ncbi:Calcium/calmodulin-dependent protein kinase type I [Coemansia sp. BCRC 34301]|nr:Calcium/calmodulin-dependent protein kinase type I [Coemansia sp. BCRC 34301]
MPSSGAQKTAMMPCKYRTGRVLGSGTYSVVREMEHIATGKLYAGKVISKQVTSNQHALLQEISILKQLSRQHTNILTLVDCFETPSNVYLITELCTGGELFEHILCRTPSFSEHDAAGVVRQIVSGVKFLHDHGVVHRDLKAENCLFRTPAADSTLAIADFGMSQIIDSSKEGASRVLTAHCGTPGYMAPEMVLRTGYGMAVDMWAVGVIAFFVLSGHTPFERANARAEAQAVVACDYKFEPLSHWRHISPAAQHFIAALLVSNPERRMTAAQALAHPWVQGQTCMIMPPVSPSMPHVFRVNESSSSDSGYDDKEEIMAVATPRPDSVAQFTPTEDSLGQSVTPPPTRTESGNNSQAMMPCLQVESASSSNSPDIGDGLHGGDSVVSERNPLGITDVGDDVAPPDSARTLCGGEEVHMGSRNLLPGLARSRAARGGLLHSFAAHLLAPNRRSHGRGLVSERTSQMQVNGLLSVSPTPSQ